MRNLYINSTAIYSTQLDLKNLVPDANLRRRMSQILKMGVAAGQQCLSQLPDTQIDTIITATALGCTADSEKFLKAILTDQNPSPTAFIQSTFNTLGSQLAILNNCHGENLTFVNRQNSLKDALTAATIALDDGAKNILLVVADEMTESVDKILTRLHIRDKFSAYAYALLISAEKNDHTLLTLTQ